MITRRVYVLVLAFIWLSLGVAFADKCVEEFGNTQTWRPLRVKFAISHRELDERLVKEVLPSVASFLGEALWVREIGKPVRAYLGCDFPGRGGSCLIKETPACREHTIPDAWYASQGAGMEGADMVIYVTDKSRGEPGCRSPEKIASASACHHDVCGRPVTGYLNICDSRSRGELKLQASVLHETLHALGFHYRNFHRFREPVTLAPRVIKRTVSYLCNKDPVSGRFKVKWNVDPRRYPNDPTRFEHTFADNLLQKINESDRCSCPVTGSAKDYSSKDIEDCLNASFPACGMQFAGPAVTREAKAFFGCETSTGVKLDDRSPSCGALLGDHWHRDSLYGEIMSPTSHPNRLDWVSPMTLALFEDSGWYKVNYDMASRPEKDHTWGFQRGCQFSSPICRERMEVAPDVFCKKEKHQSHVCSPSALYVERCSDRNKVCPHFIDEKGCFMDDQSSRCLYQAGKVKKPDCFKVKCNKKRNQYKVELNGDWSQDKCRKKGQLLGPVECQDPSVICKNYDLRYLDIKEHFQAFIVPPPDRPVAVREDVQLARGARDSSFAPINQVALAILISIILFLV